jgi:hypothetical protein
MVKTKPGKTWDPDNADKKYAILIALMDGKKRYKDIWNSVKGKIGSKTTFQLYLTQLEKEEKISRKKTSHKQVEFKLLLNDQQKKELQEKRAIAGIIENIKKSTTPLFRTIELPLHPLTMDNTSINLNYYFHSSMPKQIEDIKFSDFIDQCFQKNDQIHT